MKIRFLGTLSHSASQTSSKHRLWAMVQFELDYTTLQIDAGNIRSTWKMHPATHLLITHPHPDHIKDLKHLDLEIPVFFPKKLKKYFPEDKYPMMRRYVPIPANRISQIGHFMVYPFPVIHSKFPTYCYLVSDGSFVSAYCPDVLNIRNKKRVLKDIDMYIGCGNSISKDIKHGKYGHASVETQAKWLEMYGVKHFVVTHLGDWVFDKDKYTFYEEMTARHPDINFIIAEDGLELDSKNIPKTNINAIILENAEELWKNPNQTFRGNILQTFIGNPKLIADCTHVYGYGEVKEITEGLYSIRWINRLDIPFLHTGAYSPYAHISLKERDSQKILSFAPILSPRVLTILYLHDRYPKQLIKDVRNYDPSKISTKVLRDDFRIVTAWYSTLKRTGKFKYSEATLVKLAEKIVEELHKRGAVFHPSKMKPYAKELYDKVKQRLKKRGIELRENVVELPELGSVTAEMIQNMTDEELKALYNKIHEEYHKQGKVTEELLNLDILVLNEMHKRGMEIDIQDELDEKARFFVEEYLPPSQTVF